MHASGYLLIPISLVLHYGTLHKMSLKNMHTNSLTHPLGCLFPLNFPYSQIYFIYL